MQESAEITLAENTGIRGKGWFILSGFGIGHSVFHWFLQGFVVLLPEVQASFQLNGVGVGAILTIRELTSGAVTLPAGFILDTLRRHWWIFLAVCIGVLSLGSIVMGISPVYPLLVIGLAAVAMSHSIWHLLASASISQTFPHNRGMSLSFHGVGGSVGDVLGPVITGALLVVLSWRGILSSYAVLPMFLAFLALWTFRNISRTSEAHVKTFDTQAQIEQTKRLLKNRVLWAITFVKGLRGMALVALLTILPLYLGNDLGLSTFARGIYIGLLIAIGIAAKPVAGHLSDRFGRKQVLVPGLLWTCAVTLLLVPFGDGISLAVLIALLGLFVYPDQPIVTAAILDLVEDNVASTALGITSFIGFLMSAMSPLVAGALYEFVSVEAALYYIGALFFIAAITLVPLSLIRSKSVPESAK